MAIKELGTNGGGFFNVNSAMPFENPTALTNFVELLSIILIPAALTYTYGRMVGSQRQGWAIFAAMLVVFVAVRRRRSTRPSSTAPRPSTPPALAHARLRRLDRRQPGGQGAAQRDRRVVALGGDHHGDLQRLGQRRARVAAPASAARCRCREPGTSEVVFGGVGSGLYSMLLYVLLAVFIGGLMVGRTPEYLGKKIQAREIKLVSLGRPGHAAGGPDHDRRRRSATTCGTAVDLRQTGPQGFSETLYAYLSQANNNGSAFAGYTGFVQPNAPGQRRRLRDHLRRPARRR